MKKSFVLAMATFTFLAAGSEIIKAESNDTQPIESINDAFKNGKFSANFKAYYFERDFQPGHYRASKAFTAGGVFRYETASYHGLKLGAAYYGSHNLFGIVPRDEGLHSGMLEMNTGDDIAFLGEAYLSYTLGQTTLKVGRQQLDTPMINNHDIRVAPTVYEAAVLRNKDIDNTVLEVGYITKQSGTTSKYNGFKDENAHWGDKGLGYLLISNKSIENLTVRAQYIEALSKEDEEGNGIDIKNYTYLDALYHFSFGDKTYVKTQFGYNNYRVQENSTLFGIKVGTTVLDVLDIALLHNTISGSHFKTVQSGIIYSDWEQGYGEYEASKSFGAQLTWHALDDLSLKVGYIAIRTDNIDLVDDYNEFNFDGIYIFNKASKVRVRFSRKDQIDESEAHFHSKAGYASHGPDRDDFRVIYYYNF